MSRTTTAPGAASDAEHLAQRLSWQLAQLRDALMVRPWQAPDLKELARLLESACRAAFADGARVWMSLSQGGTPGATLGRRLRPAGVRRAGELMEQASRRLAVLSVE